MNKIGKNKYFRRDCLKYSYLYSFVIEEKEWVVHLLRTEEEKREFYDGAIHAMEHITITGWSVYNKSSMWVDNKFLKLVEPRSFLSADHPDRYYVDMYFEYVHAHPCTLQWFKYINACKNRKIVEFLLSSCVKYTPDIYNRMKEKPLFLKNIMYIAIQLKSPTIFQFVMKEVNNDEHYFRFALFVCHVFSTEHSFIEYLCSTKWFHMNIITSVDYECLLGPHAYDGRETIHRMINYMAMNLTILEICIYQGYDNHFMCYIKHVPNISKDKILYYMFLLGISSHFSQCIYDYICDYAFNHVLSTKEEMEMSFHNGQEEYKRLYEIYVESMKPISIPSIFMS